MLLSAYLLELQSLCLHQEAYMRRMVACLATGPIVLGGPNFGGVSGMDIEILRPVMYQILVITSMVASMLF